MSALLRSTGTFALVVAVAACAPAPPPPVDLAAERAAVDAVLSDFHRLASEADFDAYFELFTDDAVFFGTDASERWTVDEFRGYAAGAPTGWTYDMTERHIFLGADGNTAWFDERLDNARYGETRGTGALVKTPEGWRIAQYNLTIPVPNALAGDLVQRIAELEEQNGGD